MTTQRFNTFVLTAAILCGVLFCTNLHARVCFVTDTTGDCAVDGGNFGEPTFENIAGDKCLELGYEKITSCEAGKTTYYCPYSTNWKKCCGKEFKHVSCTGALISGGTCNGKHKCVCDASVYKCAFNNDDVSNVAGVKIKKCGSSKYPNSVPGGGSCVQEVFSGDAVTYQTLFKKCICGSFYGIKGDDCENSSIFQNAKPSGEKCVDSDDVEWYSDCYCDRSNTSTGYPYSEDDCYPYRPNTAQSCRTRGSTYYKSCLNCDEYPAQNLDHVYNNTACNIALVDKIPNLNSNGTKAGDQSGGIENGKENCSYYYCPNKKNASSNTGPYQIMRCESGYRVSTDNDYKLDANYEKICEQYGGNGNCIRYAKYKQYEACVPVDCNEAVKSVLKSKNLTGYALFDGASLRDGDGNAITNNNEYIAVVGNDLTIDTAGENVVKTTPKLYHVDCKSMKICPDNPCNRCSGGISKPRSDSDYTMSVHSDGCSITDKGGYSLIWTGCNGTYGSGMSAGCSTLLTQSTVGVGNCRTVSFCAKCMNGDEFYDYTKQYNYRGLASVNAKKYVSGAYFRQYLLDNGLITSGSIEDSMLARSCPIVLAPTITYTAAKFPVNEALDDYNHKTEQGERVNTGSANDIPTMEFYGIHMNFDGNGEDINVMRKLHIHGGDLMINGDRSTRFNRSLRLMALDGYESKVFVNKEMTMRNSFRSTGYSYEGDGRLEILIPLENYSPMTSLPNNCFRWDLETGECISYLDLYTFNFNSDQYFKVKHFQVGAQEGYMKHINGKLPSTKTILHTPNDLSSRFYIHFVGPTSGGEVKVMTEAFLGWTGWLNSSGYATETWSQVRNVKVRLHNKLKWYLQDESDINKKYLLGLSSGSKLEVYPETNTNAQIFRGSAAYWKKCEMASSAEYQKHYKDVLCCHCNYHQQNENDSNMFVACTVNGTDNRKSVNYSSSQTIITSLSSSSCGNRATYISNTCRIEYENCEMDNMKPKELLTCE